mmetsp:Transcript_40035/g.107141  ORF Transcript_40035/g.107141 Transcript_40035/m.107141 type:complete len:674 (+) Transcript_40035:601-2622(+)
MLRRGMLSQLGSGLMLVDAESASVVEANDFILSRVGKTASAVSSAPLSSIFSASSAKEAGIVLRHLSRNRGNDEHLSRFVLGVSMCASTKLGDSMSAEFLRCTPSSGGRPLFIVNVMPSRPLVDPASEVLRALRRLAGFRPEETCVTYVHAATPVVWESSSRPKAADQVTGFHVAIQDYLSNGKAGNDFAPVAAPWALDFLLHGVLSGEWCGLREWLVSNRDRLPGSEMKAKCDVALRAMEALDSAASLASEGEASIDVNVLLSGNSAPCIGPKGHPHPHLPGTRLEMRSIEGAMLLRMLVRGLCVFEFRMGSMGILPTVPLPSVAQSRLKEGTIPLEEMLLKEARHELPPSLQLGVREDGAVWGHFRPSPEQFAVVFGSGSGQAFHCSLLIENDFVQTVANPSNGCRGSKEAYSNEQLISTPCNNVGGFRLCRYVIKDERLFTAVRRWVRAGPGTHKFADVGGLEVRNAMLEMYYAMRSTRVSKLRDRSSGNASTETELWNAPGGHAVSQSAPASSSEGAPTSAVSQREGASAPSGCTSSLASCALSSSTQTAQRCEVLKVATTSGPSLNECHRESGENSSNDNSLESAITTASIEPRRPDAIAEGRSFDVQHLLHSSDVADVLPGPTDAQPDGEARDSELEMLFGDGLGSTDDEMWMYSSQLGDFFTMPFF